MELVGDLLNELYQSPVGIAGSVITVGGYALHTSNKIKTDVYNGVTFVGTGLLTAYAVEADAPIAFAVLNGIWSSFALYRVIDSRINFGEQFQKLRSR